MVDSFLPLLLLLLLLPYCVDYLLFLWQMLAMPPDSPAAQSMHPRARIIGLPRRVSQVESKSLGIDFQHSQQVFANFGGMEVGDYFLQP